VLVRLGHGTGAPIPTDLMERATFQDLKANHAIDLICRKGGVRTIGLAPPGSSA